MNTVKIDKYFRGMIAHRGLSGIETENTINAFVAAANRSYFGIECDVHVSRDGKLIVTHDDTLLRLGMLNIYIPSYRYDEIRRFTLLDRKTGHLSDNLIIPLLQEYLSICKVYQKHAMIELKGNLSLEDVDNVVDTVVRFHDLEQTSFLSFNEKYLVHLRKNHTEQSIYYLTSLLDDHVFDLCEKNRFNLDVEHQALTEAAVKRLHLVGLKVCVYTVNDKDQAEKLIKMGVDYITTDILE
ncbi:MAG: hypothetical protein JXB20_04675 [Bacilli bacterium]|nr:hypothetical protein [Bacilli bacterium]